MFLNSFCIERHGIDFLLFVWVFCLAMVLMFVFFAPISGLVLAETFMQCNIGHRYCAVICCYHDRIIESDRQDFKKTLSLKPILFVGSIIKIDFQ